AGSRAGPGAPSWGGGRALRARARARDPRGPLVSASAAIRQVPGARHRVPEHARPRARISRRPVLERALRLAGGAVRIEILSNPDAVAARAAQWLAGEARPAASARGRLVLAVSGGRTPPAK